MICFHILAEDHVTVKKVNYSIPRLSYKYAYRFIFRVIIAYSV